MCWIVLRWDDFSMCFCICKTRWILVKDQRLDEFSFFVPSVSILRGEILEQIVNLNWSDKSFSGCNGSQGDAFTKAPSDDFEIWGWDCQDCNILSHSQYWDCSDCTFVSFSILRLSRLQYCLVSFSGGLLPSENCQLHKMLLGNIILYSIPSQRLLTTLILTEVVHFKEPVLKSIRLWSNKCCIWACFLTRALNDNNFFLAGQRLAS